MINLEVPKKFAPFIEQAHAVAEQVLRPISRKYDRAEHAYPKELDIFAALADGLNAGSSTGAGAAGARGSADRNAKGNRNGGNMSTALAIMETCWGDLGLVLSIPRQGLGNSAIAAVANDEQLERYKGAWASMAITEPDAGSDSAAIRTTAVKDGDHYILNGEKIFVTAGDRVGLREHEHRVVKRAPRVLVGVLDHDVLRAADGGCARRVSQPRRRARGLGFTHARRG